ncbi:SRPBCC family protein [Frankia sp. AgKG'84/4]|uniref:SRPBCC family protein n=1 Tax=Frankia sp. AgKG'84/4 TaxID=573490 RepID=UPI002010C4B5|nr:SRPBCC family protein [Frankia sp. AgKG'84/4]MCL9794225.1 SRPBCC family protein [Frankia sp. AgKG'84/4]
MAGLFLEAAGPARVAESWERYAQPARWPDWAPQVHRVRIDANADAGIDADADADADIDGGARGEGGADGERIHPGMTGEVRSFLPPAARFVITSVDELSHTWSWRVSIGPVRLTLDHGVEPCLDAGTTTWLRLRGPLPIVLAYAPLARLALRRLVRAEAPATLAP